MEIVKFYNYGNQGLTDSLPYEWKWLDEMGQDQGVTKVSQIPSLMIKSGFNEMGQDQGVTKVSQIPALVSKRQKINIIKAGWKNQQGKLWWEYYMRENRLYSLRLLNWKFQLHTSELLFKGDGRKMNCK